MFHTFGASFGIIQTLWVQKRIYVSIARWAPTSYKWSYNPNKWPKINGFSWEYFTPISGVITTLHGCFQNSGTPKSSHSNRVFPYKPSILGYHYFWKYPHAGTKSQFSGVFVAPKKSILGFVHLLHWLFRREKFHADQHMPSKMSTVLLEE